MKQEDNQDPQLKDGALQGNPPKGGVGGILHLSSTHCISFKVGIGKESKKNELVEIELLLSLAQEHGVQQIQIYGDSLLLIKWLRNEAQIRKLTV